MKKKKLEDNPHVQKRLEEDQSIETKQLEGLLKRAVKPSKPKS